MSSINTLVTALAIFPAALFGQWPPYPTAGAPRLPDGRVNLDAPAPKTADGRPDLSGIWDRGMVPGAPPPAPANTATPPPGPRPFQNLPSLFPDGLPLQPWAAELRKQRLAEHSKDHPDGCCLPLNAVQLASDPQPRKIIQTPGLVLILYEANGGIRQIFTDGRPLPNNDPDPWWYGYSIGKWEGDTLVVETIKAVELRDIGDRDDGRRSQDVYQAASKAVAGDHTGVVRTPDAAALRPLVFGEQ
jgi:hypothetical protein